MIKLLFLLLTAGGLSAQTAVVPNPYAMAEEIPSKGKKVGEAALGLDLMGGSKSGITVFANRDNDHIIVSVPGGASQKKSISMANTSGANVMRVANRTENTFMLDVSSLSPGLYFMEVRSGQHIFRKKWIKQ